MPFTIGPSSVSTCCSCFPCGFVDVAVVAGRGEVGVVVGATEVNRDDVVDFGGVDGAARAVELAAKPSRRRVAARLSRHARLPVRPALAVRGLVFHPLCSGHLRVGGVTRVVQPPTPHCLRARPMC